MLNGSKVAIIAPKTDLIYVPEEVLQVVTALAVPTENVLREHVSQLDVMTILRRQRWSVIWWLSHADETGILLSDGVLTNEILVPMLRYPGADRHVINTCKSITLANLIHEETRATVIATRINVPDQQAFVTSTTMAFHLRGGKNFREAYELAKPPGNREYHYIGSNGTEDHDRLDAIAIMLENHGRTIDELRITAQENRAAIIDLRTNVVRLTNESSQHINRRKPRNVIQWGMAFILFVLASWMLYNHEAQEIFGQPHNYLIAGAATVFSGYLFLAAMGFFDQRGK